MTVKPENRFWIAIYGFTALIMLVALGVFGWLAWTSRNEPGIGRVAGGRPPTASASSSFPDEQYQLLSVFEAPKYRPEPGAPKSIQLAMTKYNEKDYAGAAFALRNAAATNPEFLAARFYLGISLLLSGNHISGIQELRDIAESGESAYRERSRFYLAKALIGEHDIPRARQQLESLIAQHGDLAKQAAALLAQIRPAG